MMSPAFAENIKLPNVSGQFYDADPKKLSASITTYLKAAGVTPGVEHVDILIAPHAGYVFSGPVAGYSFKAVSQKEYKTIILLAPSHFYDFAGVSVWTKGGFQTPLGIVQVDEEFTSRLIQIDKKYSFDPQAFEKEHSLEVEIPFLQKTFSDFKIVPLILGQMSFAACEELANALNLLIADRKDILVVVSSDMSHYRDGKTARVMDHETLEIINQLKAKELYLQCALGKLEMCGFVPVTTALLLAQQRGLKAQVLKYAHSGDITGDNNRVVGYGSVIFYTSQNSPKENKFSQALSKEQKINLLKIARQTIEEKIANNKILDIVIADQRLASPEGAFVTIHKDGQLRGCIGHIVSDEPLLKTVRDMAIASATADPRFSPLNTDELKSFEVEISVLSRPWRIKNVSEIQMGVHGVILSRGKGHGIFLPQVATETGWSREKFLSELCSQKAGLPADCWQDPKTIIEIFTADVFGDKNIN